MTKVQKSSAILIVFFVALFCLLSGTQNLRNIKYVKIGGVEVKVELALTKDSQQLGLSGREVLSEGTGMLFVFSKPAEYYFWMKNMHFPIDIIWIDEEMKIIYIQKDAQPEDFLSTYGPQQDSKYVLEVNAGFSDQYNLKVGDMVEFVH